MPHLHNLLDKTHLAQHTHDVHDAIKHFDTNKFLHGPTKAVPIYPSWMIGMPKWLHLMPQKDLVLPLVHSKHTSPSHPHYTSTNTAEPLFWISSKKKVFIKRNGTFYHIRISQMRNWVYDQESKDLLDVLHENEAVSVKLTASPTAKQLGH